MGLGLLAGLGKALMTGGKLTGLGSIIGQGAFGLGSDMLSNKGALRRQQLADQQNMRFWKMQNFPVGQQGASLGWALPWNALDGLALDGPCLGWASLGWASHGWAT